MVRSLRFYQPSVPRTGEVVCFSPALKVLGYYRPSAWRTKCVVYTNNPDINAILKDAPSGAHSRRKLSLAQNFPDGWHGEQNHQRSGHENPGRVDQPMTMWQTPAHDVGQVDEGVSGKERSNCQVHRP